MFKVFKDIEFKVDYEELYSRLKIRKKEHFTDQITRLVEEAQDLVKPKGIYKVAYIDKKGDDFIIVDGVKLTSKVLRQNVDKINKLFVFLVTCGVEAAEWASSKTDILDDFFADAIQEYACRLASRVLSAEIDEKYKLENPSTMNPGSLGDWSIEQQKPLFEILEGKNKEISTSLTDSFLMQPTKSVSGIRFSSDVAFCNCQMCPREDCPTRMTEYIEPMY
jgi:cobalamin-dependent methionine synthase I